MGVERLHRAAASNEADTITTLVKTSKVPVDARRHGITALHVAAHSGCAEAVAVLVGLGAAVARCVEMHAMRSSLAVPAACAPSVPEAQGSSPWHHDVGRGEATPEVPCSPRTLAPQVASVDGDGLTALHYAAHEAHAAAAAALIHAGSPLDARDAEGWAPLHDASFYGHAALVRLQISNQQQHHYHYSHQHQHQQHQQRDHTEDSPRPLLRCVCCSGRVPARSGLTARASDLWTSRCVTATPTARW